jgi:hypothetical protein
MRRSTSSESSAQTCESPRRRRARCARCSRSIRTFPSRLRQAHARRQQGIGPRPHQGYGPVARLPTRHLSADAAGEPTGLDASRGATRGRRTVGENGAARASARDDRRKALRNEQADLQGDGERSARVRTATPSGSIAPPQPFRSGTSSPPSSRDSCSMTSLPRGPLWRTAAPITG